MALFLLVALRDSAPALQTALSSKIAPESLYTIEPGKWIVDSPTATSRSLGDSLEVPATEPFIVVPVTGYSGRAQPDLWEWIAAKMAEKATAKV
jgi:hypothetical protein